MDPWTLGNAAGPSTLPISLQLSNLTRLGTKEDRDRKGQLGKTPQPPGGRDPAQEVLGTPTVNDRETTLLRDGL
jgi:hypothetical protein